MQGLSFPARGPSPCCPLSIKSPSQHPGGHGNRILVCTFPRSRAPGSEPCNMDPLTAVWLVSAGPCQLSNILSISFVCGRLSLRFCVKGARILFELPLRPWDVRKGHSLSCPPRSEVRRVLGPTKVNRHHVSEERGICSKEKTRLQGELVPTPSEWRSLSPSPCRSHVEIPRLLQFV